MRLSRPRVLFSCLALAVVTVFLAVGPAPARDDDGKEEAPKKVDATFAGSWETTFGQMTLEQNGAKVRGTYDIAGVTCSIVGTVEGPKLTFTYREPDARGEGWFELDADGKSFSGQWRPRGRGAFQPWTGRRVGASSGRASFDGLFTTRWGRMRLQQIGDAVEGIYGSGGHGRIKGTVEGEVLTFDYEETSDRGSGRFELAPDGSGFSGTWTPEGGAESPGWNGTRVVPVPGRRWLVIIEARWEESLVEREYSFGEMNRAFFARSPNVEVRHRFFSNEAALLNWCAETAYLAEPTVLSIATHGEASGIVVGNETLDTKRMATQLRYAENVSLLHFSACEIMKDRLAKELLTDLGDEVHFPISGYTTSVDWAASAIIEFTYFDLILSREIPPEKAAQRLPKLLPFAGDEQVEGAPFASAGFKIVKKSTARRW